MNHVQRIAIVHKRNMQLQTVEVETMYGEKSESPIRAVSSRAGGQVVVSPRHSLTNILRWRFAMNVWPTRVVWKHSKLAVHHSQQYP